MQGLDAYAQVGGEIPRLLRRPVPCRAGGDPGDVQPPGAVLEEHQRIQPPAEGGVDVKEVCRDDALSLRGQELAPGGT